MSTPQGDEAGPAFLMPDSVPIAAGVATIIACVDALTTKRLPSWVARTLLILVAVVLLIRAVD